jgi:hypothetical protein
MSRVLSVVTVFLLLVVGSYAQFGLEVSECVRERVSECVRVWVIECFFFATAPHDIE